MKQFFKRTSAFVLSVLLIAGLCSCGMEQYSVQRPPDAAVQDSSSTGQQVTESTRIGFYTDQTKSMLGFCGKRGYVTTLNEVRSLLKGDVLKQLDIYRYDSIVHQIDEKAFIQHYSDNVLNTSIYYSKGNGGIASQKLIEKAAAASKKGNVKPLEFALNDAFKTDKYTDSLCVFTTDGYEQNRDYSVLFRPLSEKVFKRGNAVAFMGIRSDFDGKVLCVSADNGDGYKFKGKRLFFLIVTGPVSDVVPFCSSLSDRLKEKDIENYYSTFVPSGKTVSFVEDSVTLGPDDPDADDVKDVKEGNSFFVEDMSDTLVTEEGKDYFPTFSARLPKNSMAMSTFTIATKKVMEGVELPPLRVEAQVMSYNGTLEDGRDDVPDEDEVKDKGKKKDDEPQEPAPKELAITVQPKDFSFTPGEDVTLSLQAEGEGLTYQWYFKKKAAEEFTLWNGRIHATETSTPNNTWDGIQFYCIVTDNTGNTVQSDTITATFKKKSGSTGVSPNASPDGDSAEVEASPEIIGLKVSPAPYAVRESVVLNPVSISKDGKLIIQTMFNDPVLVKDNGDILVKYSVHVGKIVDTPQWILDNSSSGISTKEEKAKTLDLAYVYEGLKQVCNATLDDSELFTFYCYYN